MVLVVVFFYVIIYNIYYTCMTYNWVYTALIIIIHCWWQSSVLFLAVVHYLTSQWHAWARSWLVKEMNLQLYWSIIIHVYSIVVQCQYAPKESWQIPTHCYSILHIFKQNIHSMHTVQYNWQYKIGKQVMQSTRQSLGTSYSCKTIQLHTVIGLLRS